MSCEVAITNAEPCRLAECLHCLEAVKRVAANAPAALGAQDSGEHVNDRVNVRRYVKAPPFVIVAGIHNDCEFLRRHHAAQSIHELCPASTASEDGDHAALRG